MNRFFCGLLLVNIYLSLYFYTSLVFFKGRLHSGIDDALNICKILKALVSNGFVMEPTSSFTSDGTLVNLSRFGSCNKRPRFVWSRKW